MGLHKDIYNYLSAKINATSNVQFNLYHRYSLQGEQFSELVFNSVDWNDSGTGAENNVVVEYNGTAYNTQFGQYTLDSVNYVPCIIEDYIGEFEPLSFVKKISYTIPISFWVNQIINDTSDDAIFEDIEAFQNAIRGLVTSDLTGYKALLNHSDIIPTSGLIDFNGMMFRQYQVVVYMELIDSGYFGNEIVWNVTQSELNGGATFRVYPILMGSTVDNDNHMFQKFNTATNSEFYGKAVPNASGFGLELSFLFTGDEFTTWLYNEKYGQQKPKKITISLHYPDTSPDKSRDYVVENISGSETIGQAIVLTMMLRPVSEVYI